MITGAVSLPGRFLISPGGLAVRKSASGVVLVLDCRFDDGIVYADVAPTNQSYAVTTGYVIVTDQNDNFSLSASNGLAVSGTGNNNTFVGSSTGSARLDYTRTAGFVGRVISRNRVTGAVGAAFGMGKASGGATYDNRFVITDATTVKIDGAAGSSPAFTLSSASADVGFALVMLATGALYLMNDNGTISLLFLGTTSTQDECVKIGMGTAAQTLEWDNLQAGQCAALANALTEVAYQYVTPDSSTVYGAGADLLAEVAIALPAASGVSAGTVMVELRYRRQDANNYMWARIDRHPTLSVYRLLHGYVSGGSSTTLTTVTNTGTPDRLVVRASGSAHKIITGLTGTPSERINNTDSHFSGSTDIRVVWDASVTVSTLWALPITHSAYNAAFS